MTSVHFLVLRFTTDVEELDEQAFARLIACDGARWPVWSLPRARGRLGGRPLVLDAKKIALAKSLYEDPTNSPSVSAETLGVSRPMLYRYLSPRRSIAHAR